MTKKAPTATSTTTPSQKTSFFHSHKNAIEIVGILLLFLLLSVAYFAPAIFEGRILFQQDVTGTSGIASDVRATGERAYWTNSLFGGMPMYQIAPTYPSNEKLAYVQKVLQLRTPLNVMGEYAWLLFSLMVGFYLFLRALEVKKLPSAVGGILWAFSSYFVILIAAGHIWKLTTLCFIPPTLAGMIWIYRGKSLMGGAVMALSVALQILSNHLQMTYYFLFVMFFLWIALLVEQITASDTKKKWENLLNRTAVMLFAGCIGVAINATGLYHTYQYSQETMRGGSELSHPIPTGDPAQAEATLPTQTPNAKGLQLDYITQWSYGTGELWTLLIPNTKGGASGSMASHEKAFKQVPLQLQPHVAQFPSYWGNQPFTSGPVYVGALVCLLFLIGLFIVKGPIKWALLAATIFSVLLSLGKNFMPLTEWFVAVVPLYNKFRAVSSILVIAEFTMPALAILALVELLRKPQEYLRDKRVWIPTSVLVGILLLLWMVPSLLPFLSHTERIQLAQAMAQDPAFAALQEAVVTARITVFRADVMRSLFLILLGIVPFILVAKNRIKPFWAVALIGVISLVDLWQIDKRYLHDQLFLDPSVVTAQAAPQTQADRTILQDKTLGYRVLNLSVNTFNDATTSRWHLSVGGYHAAKLQRYQEVIDYYLSKNHLGVINMLNTRYVILPQPDAQPEAVFNPDALGPAWFVKRVKQAANADQELALLGTENLQDVAIMGTSYAPQQWPSTMAETDSISNQGQITLLKHTPSEIHYQTSHPQEAVAVFSEIFYPHGWTLTIDGKEAPIFRANYILRSAIIPAGTHSVVFSFHPKSIQTTEIIAFTALALLLLMFVALVAKEVLKKKTK